MITVLTIRSTMPGDPKVITISILIAYCLLPITIIALTINIDYSKPSLIEYSNDRSNILSIYFLLYTQDLKMNSLHPPPPPRKKKKETSNLSEMKFTRWYKEKAARTSHISNSLPKYKGQHEEDKSHGMIQLNALEYD